MGLSCALALPHREGRRVTVLDKGLCGGGASGRSSGFVTPDSELSLAILLERMGRGHGAEVVGVRLRGRARIKEQTSKEFGLACDYEAQDSLLVANDGPRTTPSSTRIGRDAPSGTRVACSNATRCGPRSTPTTLFGGVRYDGDVRDRQASRTVRS
jgi:hypothetical protein